MSLAPYLVAWRTTPLHDREVIDALVDPAHAKPSSALQAALKEWPGTYYWSYEPGGRHLVLTRPTAQVREGWSIHILLFLATLFSTTMAGAVFGGAFSGDAIGFFRRAAWDSGFLAAWSRGLPFSLPLLAVLLCHEMGHYLAARRYQLSVSPPYFLPGFPAPFGIGTFGAFIRLRTILTDRRQLLDVGAAGPIAGFVIALPVLWIGLTQSQITDATAPGMWVTVGRELWPLGDSLITLLVRALALDGGEGVLLHPMAFAGWLGMFVTMLNLLPIAQLDGGHILYAVLPRMHQRLARAFWFGIMLMGWFWIGWLFWAFVVLLLSRGQLGHPPVLDAYRPLPRSRRWLAWASLVLFLLTFSPAPFRS